MGWAHAHAGWAGGLLVGAVSLGVLGYFAQSLARQFRGYHRLRTERLQDERLLVRALARAVPPGVAARWRRGDAMGRTELGRVWALRVRNASGRWLRWEATARRLGWFPAQALGPTERCYYYLPLPEEPEAEVRARIDGLAREGVELTSAVGRAALRIEPGLWP